MREENQILVKGGNCPPPIRKWSDIPDLPSDVKENFRDLGYENPTPIQMQAIPIGNSMRDMIALAPTGSGKSVAFLLPLIMCLLR